MPRARAGLQEWRSALRRRADSLRGDAGLRRFPRGGEKIRVRGEALHNGGADRRAAEEFRGLRADAGRAHDRAEVRQRRSLCRLDHEGGLGPLVRVSQNEAHLPRRHLCGRMLDVQPRGEQRTCLPRPAERASARGSDVRGLHRRSPRSGRMRSDGGGEIRAHLRPDRGHERIRFPAPLRQGALRDGDGDVLVRLAREILLQRRRSAALGQCAERG